MPAAVIYLSKYGEMRTATASRTVRNSIAGTPCVNFLKSRDITTAQIRMITGFGIVVMVFTVAMLYVM